MLERTISSAKSTMYVGDGINDSPSLARADVGVAMGSMGQDSAIEAADLVIMTDNLEKLPTAVKIARKTIAISWQNIIFALGVKGLILILGLFGIANMWLAVFADVGVAVLAILNSMRSLRAPK
jgi:Cd2+/Zn2+-exporting ATPase